MKTVKNVEEIRTIHFMGVGNFQFGNFTLIELLVVVSIISVLISMLLPALKNARDATYRTGCLNNLKNVNLAITMYTTEYDGFYPHTKVNSKEAYPQYQVEEYMKSKSYKNFVTFCPADTRRNSFSSTIPCKPGAWWGGPWGAWYCGSYTNNCYVFSWETQPHKRTTNVKKPLVTMLFADGSRNFCSNYSQYFYTLHKSGVNMTFADGHSEWENLKVPHKIYLESLSTYVLPTTLDGYPWGDWQ